MIVKLLFFGRLQDYVDAPERTFSLEEGTTVAGLLGRLENEPGLESKLGQVAVAVDERYAMPTTILADGQVVALMPPVSGG